MQHSLEQITDIIVKTLKPEKLFLLGTITNRYHSENIFTGRVIRWEGKPSYDVLVLVPLAEQHSYHDLEDFVETQCRPVAPVTAIVQAIRQFNEWLAIGHPFASKVYRSAHLLHNANTVPMKTPPSFDPFTIEAFLRQEFQQYLQQSREFLAAAVVQLLQGQVRQAATSARESAEKAFKGSILWVTGLQTNTHNIDKLYRYSRMLSQEMAALFPRDTEKEKSLFTLLHGSYVHPRYQNDQQIEDAELEILLQRIRQLQLIADNLLMASYHH